MPSTCGIRRALLLPPPKSGVPGSGVRVTKVRGRSLDCPNEERSDVRTVRPEQLQPLDEVLGGDVEVHGLPGGRRGHRLDPDEGAEDAVPADRLQNSGAQPPPIVIWCRT